jgi:hypothetical protein
MLLIAAALLVAVGILNFAQRATHKFPPKDGITWIQDKKRILAKSVEPNSSGARAGVLPGDYLIGIGNNEDENTDQVKLASEVQIFLEEAGIGGHLTYLIERPSYPESTRFYYADLYNLQPEPRWRWPVLYLNLIGIAYLLVGFFVLFKQGGRTPFVFHFALTFLVAFVFHFFTPAGKFDRFDMLVSWLDEVAYIFFAPLFLHFCAIYPVRYRLSNERPWTSVLLYVPAIVLLILSSLVYLPPSKSLFAESFDLVGLTYKYNFTHLLAGLLAGSGFLIWRFLKSEQAIYRQQLKWVVWGSVLAIVPFVSIYGVRYLFDLPADRWTTAIAIAPLVLIPLTFGNSVTRYRLMDVDIVARRAVVYAFTTIAIAMLIGAIVLGVAIYTLGDTFVLTEVASGNLVLLFVTILAMACVVMVAAPVRHFLQERADRFFYGETYDMRRSLLDFGRTLSATTALEPLLNALVSRLQQVLNVERIAIFIEDERESSGYRVARSVGLEQTLTVPSDFREMIRARSAETGIVRADDLDIITPNAEVVRRTLHYYVPCVVRGRMVAVIGLGRSASGALLSSEDVEILRTVSGYVAVAIENSLLYQEQQKRATELELLKEFNESIVESVNVGLLAVDLEGRVTSCNSTLEKILGIKRKEVIGKYVEDLFAEDFADTLDQVLGHARWHLHELRNLYKIHTATRNDRSLVLNVSLAPLQAATAGRTGAIVVIEDVTARARLEEQLQQREKLSSIGLLAAGVAHEVNTPLTGVSSYTQMLLGMIPQTDPKHVLLQKVHRQADRASNIVNNLLNFSRVGNTSEFSDIDIHRVLDDTLQLLEPQLRRSQIEIVRNYQIDVPKISGIAGKLQQVFTNLLLNARDAIPDSGVIELTTHINNDDTITIEVRDTGIGIAPENVSKIYDPFFTTKGVGRGTGLGLAVSYGIVQEHSGHISVESAPGHGTTFRITLPVAESHAQQLQAVGD